MKHNLPLCSTFCNQTVLGHGIYLSDKERKKIKQKGASISHCPNSNLSWVVCALKKWIDIDLIIWIYVIDMNVIDPFVVYGVVSLTPDNVFQKGSKLDSAQVRSKVIR